MLPTARSAWFIAADLTVGRHGINDEAGGMLSQRLDNFYMMGEHKSSLHFHSCSIQFSPASLM